MWDAIGKIRPQIEYKFWAGLGQDGQTLSDLIHKMEDLGNTVLEIDKPGQRLLVAALSEPGPPQWGCRICLEEGSIVIVDTETELIGHCDTEHLNWRNK